MLRCRFFRCTFSRWNRAQSTLCIAAVLTGSWLVTPVHAQTLDTISDAPVSLSTDSKSPLDGNSEASDTASSTPAQLPATLAKPPHVVLPQDVQVVSIQTPETVGKRILGPQPFPGLAVNQNAEGHLIAGLKVGTTSIVEFSEPQLRQGQKIYASVEIFGHLHRPSDIDPLKYPLRITL
ncbi:MAG: hypothetical protein RJA81_413, partial [Planctomycetota bacterium]